MTELNIPEVGNLALFKKEFYLQGNDYPIKKGTVAKIVNIEYNKGYLDSASCLIYLAYKGLDRYNIERTLFIRIDYCSHQEALEILPDTVAVRVLYEKE